MKKFMLELRSLELISESNHHRYTMQFQKNNANAMQQSESLEGVKVSYSKIKAP